MLFEGDVSIQVYATPAGYRSFGWHYDCEDVFIVQTSGMKEYLLRRNTVNPAPTIDAMPRDMRLELETSPAIACTLIAGDWLYIPRGWWHVAAAIENSLSISVGVLTPAARGSRRPGQRGVTRRG
jgi:ribosomal protein L16 Arg81 hydroxylase